ncbi:MAG: hypothetical protein KDI04_02880 [Halieaceae bacterium]|nr:hypothetical protein [Halieaceae bacterium]MCP5188283.1 hypothetical protein [Pseudomonadales bacterium]
MTLRWLMMAGLSTACVVMSGCAGQDGPYVSLAEEAAPVASTAPTEPGSATPAAAAAIAAETGAGSWPRSYTLSDATLRVFQPQVESWQDNLLRFRVAADASTGSGDKQEFGVFFGNARTQVDRSSRSVTLADVTLTRSNFPTLADNGDAYRQALQQQLAASVTTISLDRLQASLAASGSVQSAPVTVRNVPPEIIVSDSPAILIPIAGEPVIKAVPDSNFQRVINTRALLLRSGDDGPWYLHVYDGWLQATSLQGDWTKAGKPPAGVDTVAEKLARAGQANLLDGGAAKPAPTLANGVPMIYLREQPAELIVFKGKPRYQPIQDTRLLWADNTTADVIIDTVDNHYYLLLSGRWYRSTSLDDGPWSYVASDALPPDFSRIPPSSPAGVVLAAVAGTPQAREAVIENSIPQTANVRRTGGPTFQPELDGAARWRDIEGTDLQYVVNSETPIIQVPGGGLYALNAGVWFTALALTDQWTVATSVPAGIYSIPPSSSLYYVTYVRIYGYDQQYVYEGYTPGYLGTVEAPDGTVVYGTGYNYTPWVGDVYYAAPDTYGVQAQPIYNQETGMAYGFGLGLTTAAMMDAWYNPVYYSPYYYGYPCCGSTSANVYGHWGATQVSGTRTYYSDSSGKVGVKSSGNYYDDRTGTSGTYSTNRYENPYQGQAGRSMDRTMNTAAGGSGEVDRSETYNANHNQTSYDSSGSFTTAGGSTVSRDTDDSWGNQGDSTSHDTTVDNARTGQTNTYSSGSSDGDHYASANGQNYRNDGSGWQKQTADGWQDASREDTSWADREQQARSQGDARASSFQGSAGGADRSFGGGDSSLGGGARSFGGGDRSFGGGGWGSHFGGGGFGGRFGGGGFGGFHGRR